MASVFVASMLAATTSWAEDLRFFDESGIDYWAVAEARIEASPEKPVASPEESKSDTSSFDWQKVMDPKNDEFFREGDYIPPAAFMEVARDPSDQNIRMWQAYIERKNTLAARLQQRLMEYNAQNGGKQVQPATPPAPVKAEQSVEPDPKRFRFRMYFDSECPHCRRMMTTLGDLAQRGFFVEAMQVDDRPLLSKGAPFAITRAVPEDVKRHGISSVPFLLVGDVKEKVVYKMAGFKTTDEIFSEIPAGKRGARP